MLLSFDTDRIKDYVFATTNLREIRGASALLDETNRLKMPDVISNLASSSQEVYSHGGSGMFVVPEAKALSIKQAVSKMYRDTTRQATITAAEVPLPPGFDFETPIGALRQVLAYRLRMAKDTNQDRITSVTSPLFRFCASCGVNHATNNYLMPGETQPVQLCQACYCKNEKDRQIKKKIPQWFSGASKGYEPGGQMWGRLALDLYNSQYFIDEPLDRPNSFEDLGNLSNPKGYLGLIVADGDGMGEYLSTIENLRDYQNFANTVDRVIIQALTKAIAKYLPWQVQDNAPVLPFDILLLGGDDLVLVTTAEAALDVTIDLVEEFTRLTAAEGFGGLKLSASVVIAHASYPFQIIHRLGETALKFAKKTAVDRRRQGRTYETGLINFIAISNQVGGDYRAYYQKHLVTQSDDVNPYSFIRTLRPYSPQVLRHLVTVARQLKNTPRSRLHQLYEACFMDHHNSLLTGALTWIRWPNNEERRTLQHLFQYIQTELGDLRQEIPWLVRNNTEHYTPLVDLIEILDFVGKGGAD